MEAQLTEPHVLATVALVTGVVVLLALAVALYRPRAKAGAVRVAHTARLRDLPIYRRAVRRRRLALGAVALVLLVAIGVSAYVAARPSVVETHRSQLDNRDIVLCLDTSGSMKDQNLAVVRTFRQLTAELAGERIALVVFNSMPLVLFPLTDDYDLARTELADAEASLEQHGGRLGAGAYDLALGVSLVGDGLQGCVRQFTADDEASRLRGEAGGGAAADATRSRVIILATDNQQRSRDDQELFTVTEAAEHARSLGAAVITLDANPNPDSQYAAELMHAAEITGGAVYPVSGGADAVEEIAAIVDELESRTVQGEPVTARFDSPEHALSLLAGVVAALVVGWAVVRP